MACQCIPLLLKTNYCIVRPVGNYFSSKVSLTLPRLGFPYNVISGTLAGLSSEESSARFLSSTKIVNATKLDVMYISHQGRVIIFVNKALGDGTKY